MLRSRYDPRAASDPRGAPVLIAIAAPDITWHRARRSPLTVVGGAPPPRPGVFSCGTTGY